MTDYRPAEGPPPRTLRPGQQPTTPRNDAEFLAEFGEIVLDQTTADLDAHRYERMRRVPSTERRLQTVTVEVTMEVRGDLRRFIDSALGTIPTRGGRKEWSYLDG